VLKSAILVLPFFISPNLVSGQTTPAIAPSQTLSKQELELLRLQAEKQAQQTAKSDFKSDFEHIFGRTTVLFNVWLTILSLFPLLLLAILWFLRRTLIREIGERVMGQVQGIKTLHSHLNNINEDTGTLIQRARSITDELEREVEALKFQIKFESENISSFLAEIPEKKQEFCRVLENEIKTTRESIQLWESQIFNQLNELNKSNLSVQHQAENLCKLESELTKELTDLQINTQQNRDSIVDNIEQIYADFVAGIQDLNIEIQQQKDTFLNNLNSDLANRLTNSLAKSQSEVDAQLSQLHIDAEKQKGTVMEDLGELNYQFKLQISQLQTDTETQGNTVIANLAHLQSEFADKISQLQADTQLRQQLIVEDLEKSARDLTGEFSELRKTAQQRQRLILEKLDKLEVDFVQELKRLKLSAQKNQETISAKLMAEIPQEPKTEVTKTGDDFLQAADQFFAEKNYPEAFRLYENFLKTHPDDPTVWLKRGIVLGRLKRYPEAIASYDTAIKIQPNYHQAWCDRGVAWGNLGKHEEAFKCFDRATTIQPEDGIAWLNRGLSLLELEQFDLALLSFDSALKFQPNSPKIWDKRGYTLVQLGRDEEAIACFDTALKIKPDYAGSYYNRAACYALQQEVDLAVNNLQAAIQLNPQYKEEVLTDINFTAIKQDAKFQSLFE